MLCPSCHLLVAAHSQERPTAAVTPIQAQSSGYLGPAAHTAAVSVGWVGAPLACAPATALTSPSIATSSLETELGGRVATIVPGPPASPDSASAAGGSGSAFKPEKDSKVRLASHLAAVGPTPLLMEGHVAQQPCGCMCVSHPARFLCISAPTGRQAPAGRGRPQCVRPGHFSAAHLSGGPSHLVTHPSILLSLWLCSVLLLDKSSGGKI